MTFDEATLLDDSFIMSKKVLFSPCTSVHKHEQKGTTKTLVKFPDHISIAYGFIGCAKKNIIWYLKRRITGKFESMNVLTAAKPLNTSL